MLCGQAVHEITRSDTARPNASFQPRCALCRAAARWPRRDALGRSHPSAAVCCPPRSRCCVRLGGPCASGCWVLPASAQAPPHGRWQTRTGSTPICMAGKRGYGPIVSCPLGRLAVLHFLPGDSGRCRAIGQLYPSYSKVLRLFAIPERTLGERKAGSVAPRTAPLAASPCVPR